MFVATTDAQEESLTTVHVDLTVRRNAKSNFNVGCSQSAHNRLPIGSQSAPNRDSDSSCPFLSALPHTLSRFSAEAAEFQANILHCCARHSVRTDVLFKYRSLATSYELQQGTQTDPLLVGRPGHCLYQSAKTFIPISRKGPPERRGYRRNFFLSFCHHFGVVIDFLITFLAGERDVRAALGNSS